MRGDYVQIGDVCLMYYERLTVDNGGVKSLVFSNLWVIRKEYLASVSLGVNVYQKNLFIFSCDAGSQGD